MDRQAVISHIQEQYAVDAEHPWEDRNLIFRHRENRKWFAVILEVSCSKLAIAGEGIVDVLNLKCDAILAGTLRLRPGYHAAYHMNKEKWISIRLDGTVPMEDIANLIAISYDLTAIKKRKKSPKAE